MPINSINVQKRPNEPGIIPKFSMILLFGLIYLCKQIKAGEGNTCTYVVSHTEVTCSLSEPRAFLREAPVCKKLTPKLVPIQPKILLEHVGAMSWHHAKFHDFQACFGFTWINKPSFSIFLSEARCLDVWISFSFLAWDLEIHPRTHMWFFKQLLCTGARACSSNLNYAH